MRWGDKKFEQFFSGDPGTVVVETAEAPRFSQTWTEEEREQLVKNMAALKVRVYRIISDLRRREDV